MLNLLLYMQLLAALSADFELMWFPLPVEDGQVTQLAALLVGLAFSCSNFAASYSQYKLERWAPTQLRTPQTCALHRLGYPNDCLVQTANADMQPWQDSIHQSAQPAGVLHC